MASSNPRRRSVNLAWPPHARRERPIIHSKRSTRPRAKKETGSRGERGSAPNEGKAEGAGGSRAPSVGWAGRTIDFRPSGPDNYDRPLRRDAQPPPGARSDLRGVTVCAAASLAAMHFLLTFARARASFADTARSRRACRRAASPV